MRDVFKLVYRIAMILITVGFAVGGVSAYWFATPGNGLLLVSGILAVLTLMAALSISKLDDQDARVETYRGIIDDMRARFPVSIRFANSEVAGGQAATVGNLEWKSDDGAPVSVQFGDPEVHRVDAPMLDEAKRMAADGAPIDEICRTVDPDHDRHGPVHQEAFRRIVRAMIDQG